MLGRDRPTLAQLLSRPADTLEAEGWDPVMLGAGQRLWAQGSQTDSLAYVHDGRLSIEVGGTEIDRVGAGELLGEASVFVPQEQRTADVRALDDTRLWVLSRPKLVRLQTLHPELYDALIEAAIVVLARRIGDNERELRRRQRGSLPPPTREPASWWKRMTRAIEGRRPPPFEDAVEALPTFGRAERLVTKLGELAQPLYVPQGEALCIEGDPAESMYILATGRLTVMLLSGDGAFDIGSVGPGSLLGTSALLEQMPRSASLVAAEPTWVYELTREGLAQAPDDVWRAMAKSLLVVLRQQLVRGHQRLEG